MKYGNRIENGDQVPNGKGIDLGCSACLTFGHVVGIAMIDSTIHLSKYDYYSYEHSILV
jgi:hypothetical protein